MQKSTITFEGVDYVVRTLDIRSIPMLEDECYASVQVAEKALDDVLSPRVDVGEKVATAVDERFFFYPESEFLRKDPTDEELIDYLNKCLP